ncbi:MAG: SulP family inorganic anion transporter [Burkholderiales bacterium]|nr:SulP family inorganic anion transporter [Burkholderiales bacterium]
MDGPMNASPQQGSSRVLALVPAARWLRSYPMHWLPHDAVAGMTLAAYAIPVSLAYATLAGLPPYYGIYCYLVAGPAYALFGSSRQLAIGPTSAISILVGSTLGGMALAGPSQYAAVAALTALLFAVVSVIAWVLRLSTLVNFVSETVLLGFKAGAALTIAMTQLPKLFGVPGGGGHFFERGWILVAQIPSTNLAVLGFGVAAILLLMAGEHFLPGRPVALVVVALAIVALSVTPLAQMGFKTVGALPSGLPSLALPALRPAAIDGVVPLAIACFLLAYIEGVSAARALAQRHGQTIDPRQELLGLGAANLAAALGQGYPVAGGLSQSTVNDKAGARTPLALVFASATIALCLLYLTDLLRNLPDVVLAAIVLVAVKGLVDVRELRRTYALARTEFWIAMVALAGVLLLGILQGVLLAAIVSMLLLIGRAARPHVAKLGRIPGTQRYSDVARHPENEDVPDVLVVRVEASLMYFNVGHVGDEVTRLIAGAGSSLRRVVWDLSSSPYVDIAGARFLAALQTELASRRVELRLVEARATVRDLLRRVVSSADVDRRVTLDAAVRD